MKANYEEDKVIVSSTEPTGIDRKKVWIKKGKNLVNVSQIILGHALWSTDGTTLIHPERGYFDYILVNSNTEYSISNCTPTAICFYDKNKSFISAVTGKTAFTTPSDCTYIRFSINITKEYSNIQLEQNTVATTYEAYVEPEIYILNSNDVYERVYSKSELNKEHYSTGEQKIGTWIDGKNLYRKTIFKTAKITANTNLVINSEIQNIDTITKIDGVISSSLKNNYRQINTYNLENNAVSISMSASTNGNITIYSTDDWSTPNIIITLEYTKTTD